MFNIFIIFVSMALEIERKFLLKNLPILPDNKWDKILNIEQSYFTDAEGKISRIRIQTHENEIRFFLTQKELISHGVFEERESDITQKEYFEYYPKFERGLRKIRYVKNFGSNLKWEIDVYLTVKLVTAEIELPKIDYEFEFPDYIKENIIMEVTGMNEFSNFSLSNQPG